MDTLNLLLKIAAMFLVMALGWLAQRRGYVSNEANRSLSRLLVNMTFPALVFTQLLKTVTPAVMRAGWLLPILAILMVIIAELTGLLSVSLFKQKAKIATAVFLVALPNWIYLPLPIVEGLFGAAGVRDVLLFNVGFQVALWTLGIWTLQSARFNGPALKNLALNPGLIATAAGIILALIWPAARQLDQPSVLSGGYGAPLLWTAAAVVQALSMLGSLTIPLSLLVTGIHLGGLNLLIAKPANRQFNSIIIARLLLAPAATIAMLWLAGRLGLVLPETTRITYYLIACMPVAISGSILAESFGGDTLLAARTIFYSTLWSILTVPGWYYLIRICKL